MDAIVDLLLKRRSRSPLDGKKPGSKHPSLDFNFEQAIRVYDQQQTRINAIYSTLGLLVTVSTTLLGLGLTQLGDSKPVLVPIVTSAPVAQTPAPSISGLAGASAVLSMTPVLAMTPHTSVSETLPVTITSEQESRSAFEVRELPVVWWRSDFAGLVLMLSFYLVFLGCSFRTYSDQTISQSPNPVRLLDYLSRPEEQTKLAVYRAIVTETVFNSERIARKERRLFQTIVSALLLVMCIAGCMILVE